MTERAPVVAPPNVTGGATAPSDNTTLADVLRSYGDAGFNGQFGITEDGLLRCFTCGVMSRPGDTSLQSLRRMEGASDPSDMLAVLALSCPNCSVHGTVVVHYGPEAEPGESAVLLALNDHRADDGVPAATAPTENRSTG